MSKQKRNKQTNKEREKKKRVSHGSEKKEVFCHCLQIFNQSHNLLETLKKVKSKKYFHFLKHCLSRNFFLTLKVINGIRKEPKFCYFSQSTTPI
jgi:hypothetical protein